MIKKIGAGIFALFVFYVVYSATETAERVRPVATAPELMTRAEFMIKCRVGDGYVQCQNAVGRPDRTQGGSSATEYWYYDRRTRDAVSGRPDNNAQVVIEKGWVRGINFY